jgi:carboxypeptidase PM20D1
VDEGLSIVDGLVPGLAQPAALIGTAMKGYVSVRLIARVAGGHSSMPAAETAVGVLAGAIKRLEETPMPEHISPPISDMFDVLAPHMSFGLRLVVSNRWLFGPLLAGQLADSPATNATIRTTTAVTMIRGGVRDNVLPPEASAVVNFRIHPADSVATVLEHVREVVADSRIEIEVNEATAAEPFGPIPADSSGFQLIARAVRDTYPEVLISPALFIGAADVRHYQHVADELYLFHPLWLTAEDTARLHGVDERIAVEHYGRYITYFARLLELAGGSELERTPRAAAAP